MFPNTLNPNFKFNTRVKVSPDNDFTGNLNLPLKNCTGRIVGYGGIGGFCPLVQFDGPVGHDLSKIASPIFFDQHDEEIIEELSTPLEKRTGKSVIGNYAYIPPNHLIKLYSKQEQIQQFNKGKSTMSKAIDMIKSDAVEAGVRVAATQMTKGTKTLLIKALDAKMTNQEQKEQFKMLLDSPIGESVIAIILGYGLHLIPQLKDNPKAQKISEEFRVQAMTGVGNTIVSSLMESVMPMLNSALSQIPEETAHRVLAEESETENSEDEAENREDDVPAVKKVGSR